SRGRSRARRRTPSARGSALPGSRSGRPASKQALGEDPGQIFAVAALRELARELAELACVDEALPEGDFLGAGDLEPLPALDRLDEMRGLEQRVVRPSVEPGEAAP